MSFDEKADDFFAMEEKFYSELERVLMECIEAGNRFALWLHIARIGKMLEYAANLEARLDREAGQA